MIVGIVPELYSFGPLLTGPCGCIVSCDVETVTGLHPGVARRTHDAVPVSEEDDNDADKE